MIKNQILNGIGKKMRNAYLQGKITDKEIVLCYRRNVKEVEELCTIGWSINDLVMAEQSTHNPLLRTKFQQLIEQHKQKNIHSNNQNSLNLQKLDFYLSSALGVGLRKVIKQLHNIALQGNEDAKILCLLLQAEFANLVAKKHGDKKTHCYERKSRILMKLSDLLYDNNWKCGINYNTGKNSLYIIYVYLPNGEQVSWHSNDYNIVYCYDEIDCEWDGKPCSTLEKLLEYAHTGFNIGSNLVEYKNIA